MRKGSKVSLVIKSDLLERITKYTIKLIRVDNIFNLTQTQSSELQSDCDFVLTLLSVYVSLTTAYCTSFHAEKHHLTPLLYKSSINTTKLLRNMFFFPGSSLSVEIILISQNGNWLASLIKALVFCS